MKKQLASIFFATFLLMIVIFFIAYYRIGIYAINGTSMNPTLYEGNYVLSVKNEIKRQDIIVFDYKGANTIKRIIGLPNDVIEIKEDGIVLVNGVQIEEEYLKNMEKTKSEVKYPLTVPNDEYFVLGDNRSNSLDSRIISFGTIKKDKIKGKVIFSLIPFKKIQ